MSYAPKTLSALARYWTDHGGRALGIVGNTSHVRGYHLGKDRIFDGAGPGIGWDDYSVQTSRDKAGLSDAASGIDLGRLNGSLKQLRNFSKWLVAECQAGKPGARDVREIIYSPDGETVQRWSGIDNKIHTGPGNGDSTHLTHTHISYFRDSAARDKTGLFSGYFVTVPDTSTDEAPMPVISSYIPGYSATIKATSNVRTEPKVTGTLIRTLASKETWNVTGWVKGGVDAESGSSDWLTRWHNDRWEYTAKVNVSAGPTAPDTDPSQEIAAATAPLEAKISAKNTALRAIASEAAQAADL